MPELPSYVKEAITLLQKNGFEAYVVGGFVRDLLSGRASHDVDLTTDATPEQMQRVFAAYPVIETGLRHGTLTVLFDHRPLEITTYRTETTYSDARHPDEVRFTRSLQEDLARRDFTVNAMAYNETAGVIDPFSGQNDLQNGVLRCVGDPVRRFEEDALRILRLLRFTSVLGFSVDEQTKAAALQCRERLRLLSVERIAAEFRKLLCGKNVQNVLLEYWEILGVFLPFLHAMHGFDQHNYHHCCDVLEHTAIVTASAPPKDTLRLAAFFHDCGKPDCFSLDNDGVGHFYAHAGRSAAIANETLTRLKFDRKTIERVTLLVKLHDAPIEETAQAIKKKLNRYGADVLFDLIALQRADTMGLAPEFHTRLPHFDRLETLTREVLAQGAAFSVAALAVNGNDLLACGCQGKAIGNTLRQMVDAVIDGKVANEKEALLAYFHLSKS